ncbi:hypothetical protein LJR225_002714 [Phenylobacterium sp. LjRoot225]|uniref:hypothetical protein n=1 Tax=Phenylobacterium sp. LjRoot225 TaxID=3342285 RepID=UPI003ECE9512
MTDLLHGAAYTLVALLLLIWGGNLLCKLLLKSCGLTAAMTRRRLAAEAQAAARGQTPPPPAFDPKVGGVIGAFERLILAAGMLSGSWEVFAAVVALKTVARFKELDERLDAEYFLVGSLFSILWTIAVTTAWIAYDKTCGLDLSAHISAFVTSFKPN